MNKAPTRQELRRLARQDRKVQEAMRQQRTRRQHTALLAVIGVLVLGAAAWFVQGAVRSGSAALPASLGGSPPLPIVDYAEQSRDHIVLGEAHPAYNSNPPTSGWHYAQPADWGFYNEVLPDELVVHNLEHGGIWLSYRSKDDTDLINQLAALTQRYRSKLIVTFRPQNDTRLAVAAWGHLMKLDHYDQAAIVAFINRFRNQGPEQVPD